MSSKPTRASDGVDAAAKGLPLGLSGSSWSEDAIDRSSIMRARHLRILLVEDIAGDAELVTRALGTVEAGVSVTAVSSLALALDCLKRDPHDAVLLDLGLPDASGLESVKRIHELYTTLPIVVLTGLADDRVGIRAIRVGAEDYVGKESYDGRSLLRCLRHAIERATLRAQLEAVIERSVEAHAVYDESGTLIFVNAAAERLFGRSRESLIEEGLGSQFEIDGELEIEGGRPGDRRTVLVRTSAITWHWGLGRLVTLRDVTDERRREELERRLGHADRLASIGQLAAGVAHEVNNPSAAVVLNLSLLRDSALESPNLEERREFITQVVQESLDGMERIRRIVQDLRSFARRDAEEVEWVQLNELVSAACNITANEVRHRARLEQELGNVPMIPARPSKLGQVLVNLIMNAAQSISPGTRSDFVRVSTRTDAAKVIIAVEDTGMGVPANIEDRIFEPFFTTKPRDIGTGLGLAIARQIVREHGGELDFSSRRGGGTCFRARIPLETGLSVLEPGPHAPPSPSRGRRGRVLVVDDEEPVLRAIHRALRREHDIVLAQGGIEAERVLRTDANFDLVLCDVVMPDLDGGRLHDHVREFAPDVAERFVFVSGGAFTPDAKSFVARSGLRFYDKPIDPEILQNLIAEAVERRAQ
jgi:signal transduction histidine kinase